MKRLPRFDLGQRAIGAADLNILVDAINEIGNMQVGPGLTKAQTGTGTKLALMNSTPPPQSRRENFDGGEMLVMDSTQGTQDSDTWAKADDRPVTVKAVTDVEYSETTHKLSMRLRTFVYDRGGNLKSISAESELVEITEAEQCPLTLP